jgi:hypothetical protein
MDMNQLLAELDAEIARLEEVADGTIELFCLCCYLTAATAKNEADLHERELPHNRPNKNEFPL